MYIEFYCVLSATPLSKPSLATSTPFSTLRQYRRDCLSGSENKTSGSTCPRRRAAPACPLVLPARLPFGPRPDRRANVTALQRADSYITKLRPARKCPRPWPVGSDTPALRRRLRARAYPPRGVLKRHPLCSASAPSASEAAFRAHAQGQPRTSSSGPRITAPVLCRVQALLERYAHDRFYAYGFSPILHGFSHVLLPHSRRLHPLGPADQHHALIGRHLRPVLEQVYYIPHRPLVIVNIHNPFRGTRVDPPLIPSPWA